MMNLCEAVGNVSSLPCCSGQEQEVQITAAPCPGQPQWSGPQAWSSHSHAFLPVALGGF